MRKAKSKITNRNLKSLIFNFIFSFFIFNFSFPVLTTAEESPNCIISLAPSITEIVFSLGLGDRLVGVTTYCDYPEEAKKKPKVGGMSNPSIEAVVSLRPDIVVMTTDGNPKEFDERLQSLKIKTYVFRARRLSELPQGIRDMGLTLGVKEKADALAKEIEEAINRFKVRGQESASPHPLLSKRGQGKSKKVVFIIWPEPLIAAGSGTAITDAITLLGNENIASKAKTPYPKYSIEEIIRQSPDVIFIGSGHVNMKEVSKGLLKRISPLPPLRAMAFSKGGWGDLI